MAAPNLTDKQLSAAITVAFYHYESKRFDQAEALFETVVLAQPSHVYAMAGMAACAVAREQWQAALNWYDRALAIDQDNVDCKSGRARVVARIQASR